MLRSAYIFYTLMLDMCFISFILKNVVQKLCKVWAYLISWKFWGQLNGISVVQWSTRNISNILSCSETCRYLYVGDQFILKIPIAVMAEHQPFYCSFSLENSLVQMPWTTVGFFKTILKPDLICASCTPSFLFYLATDVQIQCTHTWLKSVMYFYGMPMRLVVTM